VNIQANLYANSNNELIWTGEIAITDPQYIDEVTTRVAAEMFADWQKNGLLKVAGK
jgi:hypothetical protein